MADERDDAQSTERSRSFGRDSSGLRGARNMIQPDAVPKPPTRSGAARNPFVVFGNSIFIILVLVAVGGYFGLRRFSAPGPLATEKVVYVPKGSGIDGIADSLERQGVIDGATAFTTGIWILGHSNDLKAGEYSFKPAASMYEVMNVLVGGKVIQHSLTVPEGLTSEAIVDRLDQDDILAGDPPPVPKEGSLLPDTYKYERGMTRAQMVSRMQAEQKALVDQVWKKRAPNLPLKSPSELVTLASIVEKETGQADERPHIAGVFINRLTHNPRMRLESDPTAIYGVLLGKARPDDSTAATYTAQDTPYNTYKIFGLPPGPIANPGRAALEAVANPMVTNDLFFVADGTGGHAFAETLEQHNRNVTRWRQMQQQGQAQPPGNDTTGAHAASAPAATPAPPAAPAPAAAVPSPAAAPPAPVDAAPAAAPVNCKPPKSKKCRNAKQTAVQPVAPPAPAPETVPAAAVPAAPSLTAPSPTAPTPTAPSPAAPAAVPATPPATPVAPAPAAPAAAAVPPATPAAPVDPAHPGVTGRKGGFDDPVANTKEDPLLDNTFDLNSPQTVQ